MGLLNDENLTIANMAPLIRKGQLSPVELTEALLERIARLQPSLNAFITVTSDLARKQARRAEKEISKGHYRGVLHGIPISVKDLFYTAGIRTTAGSKILRRFIPKENSAVVDRLLAAGTILLGKTNLHEFAFGATNINPHYGPVHNPWDLSRVSGGSSGGSAAAVSAGLCLASLGSDTGGSIRLPAAACGIVGLKPTFGLIPTHGVIPLSFSLDHVGPLCRCVEDAALVLGVIAGPDAPSLRSPRPGGKATFFSFPKGIRRLRVGVPKQYFFDRLQREVRDRVLAAHSTLEKMGAEIQEVKLEGIQDTVDLAADIIFPEAMTFHWKWLSKRPGDYGEDLRTRMQSRSQTAVTYLQALQRRQQYSDSFKKAMESVDVLAVPTIPIVAPRIKDSEVKIGRWMENVRVALLRLTFPGNLSGLPAISIPCGFSSEKLPIGLQLIGRRLEEATLLRAAYAYEQSTPWHKMFPPDP